MSEMLQWFPGHMHKTQKALYEIVNNIDVVIEVLDARAANATHNPLLNTIFQNTPKLILINKSDIANHSITNLWKTHYKGTGCHVIATNHKKSIEPILKYCKLLAPKRYTMLKPLRVIIIGVPNVGKSSFINLFTKKRTAIVMNAPATTKNIRSTYVSDEFVIYDSPGLLWHKFDTAETGYNLALCNSIGANAIDNESLVKYLLTCLNQYEQYRLQFCHRYKLNDCTFESVQSLTISNPLNINTISLKIINDFRNGKFGKISLEIPNDVF